MKKISLLFLILFPALSNAASLTYSLSDRNAKGQIKFSSEAPLEAVDGTADLFSGMVTLDPDKADLGLTAMVRVQVDGMQTGVALRDNHMKSADWLNAAAYPIIQFSLDAATPVKKKGNNRWFVNAKGQFSLKGISKQITVPLDLIRTRKKNRDELLISGRFPVKLADHNIRGPAGMKMIGVRMGEEAAVQLKLVGVEESLSHK